MGWMDVREGFRLLLLWLFPARYGSNKVGTEPTLSLSGTFEVDTGRKNSRDAPRLPPGIGRWRVVAVSPMDFLWGLLPVITQTSSERGHTQVAHESYCSPQGVR